MTDRFRCGDGEGLVAYVYDDGERAQQEAVARHLEQCASCKTQVDGLRQTRRHLDAWTPPAPTLGFEIGDATDTDSLWRERLLPWWRTPLPAWAQVAAAVLVFGAGLAVGLARDTGSVGQAPTQAVADGPSRADLVALEERVRAEMADLRRVSAVVTPPQAPDAAILQRVEALVAESEARQRREFTLRSVELARDVEAQRRVDLASVRESLGQLQGVTGVELRQQREAIQRFNNYLVSVSQQGR